MKIKLQDLINKLSLLILLILYLNLISTCLFTVSCDAFIPTMSYMATFRLHDCGVVLAMVLQSFSLLLTFISFHHSLDFKLSADDKHFLLTLEFAIIILTIACSIVDESSGLDFKPVDDAHRFITLALVILAAVWVFFALSWLGLNKLESCQIAQINFCWNLYMIGIVLVMVTMVEWVFAYSTYNGFFFNHAAESIFEWASITIAARFPYYLVKVMQTEIRVSADKKDRL